MEQGKIMEAEVPTVRVGATPTGLTTLPITPQGFLQAGCPSCHPTNSVKALKVNKDEYKAVSNMQSIILYFAMGKFTRFPPFRWSWIGPPI